MIKIKIINFILIKKIYNFDFYIVIYYYILLYIIIYYIIMFSSLFRSSNTNKKSSFINKKNIKKKPSLISSSLSSLSSLMSRPYSDSSKTSNISYPKKLSNSRQSSVLKKITTKLSITKEEENFLQEIYKEYYGKNPEIVNKDYQKEFPLIDYYQTYLSSHGKQEYSLYIFSDYVITQSDFDKMTCVGVNPDIDSLTPYVYNDFMNTLFSIRKNNKPNTGNKYIKYPIFFSGKIDSYVSEVIDRLNHLKQDLEKIDSNLKKLKFILKKIIKNKNKTTTANLGKIINNLSDENYKSIFNKLRKQNKSFVTYNIDINGLSLKLKDSINSSRVNISELLNINKLHNLFTKFDDSYIIKLRSLLDKIKDIIGIETLNNIYNNKSKVSYGTLLKYFERLIGQKLDKSVQLSNFNELSKLENKLVSSKNMDKNLDHIKKKIQERSVLIHNIKRLSGQNYVNKKREIKIITTTINQLKETFQSAFYKSKKIKINNILQRLIKLREKLGLPSVLENTELPETYNFKETNNNKYVSELLSSNVNSKNSEIIDNTKNKLSKNNQIGFLLKYNGLFDKIYKKLTDEDIHQILLITDKSEKYKYLVLKQYLDENIYKYIKHKFLGIKKGTKHIFNFFKETNTSPDTYINENYRLILQKGGFIGLEISLLSAGTVIAIVMICMNMFYKMMSAYLKYLYNMCYDKSITRLKSIKMYLSSEFRHYLIAFLLFTIEFMVGSIFFFFPHVLVIGILKYYTDFIIFIYKKQTNKSKSKIYRIFESVFLSCGPYYYRYFNSKEYLNQQEQLKNVPYITQIKNMVVIEIQTFKNTIKCMMPKNTKSFRNNNVFNNLDNNAQQIYQLVYDLGFLDSNELIMKIKKISINEIEKLDLFKSMNWSSIVEKQIELLGDSISIEEKTFYRTIVSNPNPELIKLLPLFRYIFFVQLLDQTGNYTDKKIYGIIVIDRLFSKEVFIKYNSDMEKKNNLNNYNKNKSNSSSNQAKLNSILDKCNSSNRSNIQSFLQFLLTYFKLDKKK